jgi:spore coat protein CotH
MTHNISFFRLKHSFSAFTMGILLFLSACGDMNESKVEGYGLPVVQIEMNSETLGLLLGQVTSKRPVAAEVKMQGDIKMKCEVSFAGQSSLNDYRKSLNLRSCKNHPQEQTRFRLAAQNRDKTTNRALLAYEMFARTGLSVPTTELVAAYMNHDYLGVYLLTEPISSEYFQRRGIQVADIYQSKFGNAGFRKEFSSNLSEAFDYEGDGKDNYSALQGIYKSLWDNLSDEEFERRINLQIDVENFMAYMATAVYTAHWDGFDNNYFMALDKTKKKLIVAPWDLDRVWEKAFEFSPADFLPRNQLLFRMMTIESFRKVFIKKIDLLLADFTVEKQLSNLQIKKIYSKTALAQDKINGPDLEESFSGFEEQITVWNEKIRAFRNTLAD